MPSSSHNREATIVERVNIRPYTNTSRAQIKVVPQTADLGKLRAP